MFVADALTGARMTLVPSRPEPQERERLLNGSFGEAPRRRVPSHLGLARRRLLLATAKFVLPFCSLALLASIAIWPQLQRLMAEGRASIRQLGFVDPGAGRMLEPHYQGLDARGRPYTVTAATANQDGPTKIRLSDPKGDITLQNGSWIMVQAQQGVYVQRAGLLDLSGDVILYRQDGTVMTSATTALDLKQGAATSNDYTHVEGPFGTLDAQGYTLVDKGAVVQFRGPARLVLNGGRS